MVLSGSFGGVGASVLTPGIEDARARSSNMLMKSISGSNGILDKAMPLGRNRTDGTRDSLSRDQIGTAGRDDQVASLEADCRGYREEIATLQQQLQAKPKAPEQRRDPRVLQVGKLTEDVASAKRDARAAWIQAELEGEAAVGQIAQLEAELQQALRTGRSDQARRSEAEEALLEEQLEKAKASEQFTSDRQALQARIDALSGKVGEENAIEKSMKEMQAQLEAARREAAEARSTARAQHREFNKLQVVVVEQTQLLEQLEAARQLEAEAAEHNRIVTAKGAAVELASEVAESTRLRDELARLRAEMNAGNEVRIELGRSLSSADIKVRRVTKEQVSLGEHLHDQIAQLAELRALLAKRDEEAQVAYLAIDTLERRKAEDAATIAELRRRLREQEELLRLLQHQLDKLRAQLAAMGGRSDERQSPQMSGSNFAKMMNMQLEINQLKMMNAHLERLLAQQGGGGIGLRKGQLSARNAAPPCPWCFRGRPLDSGIRMTSEVKMVDYEVKMDGHSYVPGQSRTSPTRLSPTTLGRSATARELVPKTTRDHNLSSSPGGGHGYTLSPVRSPTRSPIRSYASP